MGTKEINLLKSREQHLPFMELPSPSEYLYLSFGHCIQVLNAKPENVEREAEIVAQSGRLGAVTIATNMAGRGTDIILGGNAEFMARLKLREMLMPRYFIIQRFLPNQSVIFRNTQVIDSPLIFPPFFFIFSKCLLTMFV